jgi:methionyl-tRNA synthetase
MSDQPTTALARKPEISFDDFTKLDLRVATITRAEFHPNADRLLRIQLDDGTEAGRQVCAGIRAWYEPEQLVGKQVVIVANLQPRKIRGELSQGMILAASSDRPAATPDGEGQTDVIVLTPDRPAAPGSSVS